METTPTLTLALRKVSKSNHRSATQFSRPTTILNSPHAKDSTRPVLFHPRHMMLRAQILSPAGTSPRLDNYCASARRNVKLHRTHHVHPSWTHQDQPCSSRVSGKYRIQGINTLHTEICVMNLMRELSLIAQCGQLAI